MLVAYLMLSELFLFIFIWFYTVTTKKTGGGQKLSLIGNVRVNSVQILTDFQKYSVVLSADDSLHEGI